MKAARQTRGALSGVADAMKKGLHAGRRGHCDSVVKIPMLGYKNSMNVATAYGVVLYDILARWKAI